MASINQAHLIHDHSSGRSSTRLHAPPGGGNSMGTSFGWSDEVKTRFPPSQEGPCVAPHIRARIQELHGRGRRMQHGMLPLTEAVMMSCRR